MGWSERRLPLGLIASLVIAVVGSGLVGSIDAHAKRRMPRELACEGMAPAVSVCETSIKLQPGYRLTLEDRRLGGMQPSELFVGDIYVGIYSIHRFNRWGAKWVNGQYFRAFGGLVEGFRPGETITLRVEVVGAGPWRVAALFERDKAMKANGRQWVGCRGVSPMESGCTKTFRVGRDMRRRHYTSEDMGIHNWIGFYGSLKVRWESKTAVRASECERAGNTLVCGGEWKGSFRPGQLVTLTVEAEGHGGWRASASFRKLR